jgi:threonylcarbamoyladenosine tRNA methylthiotransferase MtaB
VKTVSESRGRVSVVSVGCRLNQAETDGIREAFEQAGYIFVGEDGEADVYVVNTCTVTSRAEATSRRLLRRARRLGCETARVVATGCYAGLDPDALVRTVAGVLTTTMEEKGDLPALLDGRAVRGSSLSLSASTPGARTRSFVKVQDGCDSRCSFCRARLARGTSRSRPLRDVVSDVRSLISAGVGEVVISGVQVGSYRSGSHDLLGLLRALLYDTDVERIRLGSVHPGNVSDGFIKLFADEDRLARQLHLPLQSGHDRVLAAMRRPYMSRQYVETARRVLETVPDVCLGADVMVGFPIETDSEFETTLELVRSVPLSYLHVFSYSDRPGTEAFSLTPKVPSDTIAQRSRVARKLRDELWRDYRRSQIGKTARVLIERPDGETRWRGLASNYVEVSVPLNDNVRGKFVNVRLTALSGKGMRGELSSVSV